MGEISQLLSQTGLNTFIFKLDQNSFDNVRWNSLVSFSVYQDAIQIHKATIIDIQHVNLDTMHCWDNVQFSVDRDWAFNISVTPLGCQIQKSVVVTLEYLNDTWRSVPIVPTVPKGSFSGYKKGDFDYQNVYFFNTSSEGDKTNAKTIINFVEFFKSNFNIPLVLKIKEKNTDKMKIVYHADIAYLGNELSQAASPQTQCTIDTWYCYVVTSNTANLVNVLSQIPGGVKILSQQYTYDAINFSVQSSFQLDLSKLSTRKGVRYSHGKVIELNDSTTYYYQTFLQLLDKNGKMLAGLYYSGVANVPCFRNMTYLWYNNKVCMRSYVIDSKQCRTRYESGVSATFVGQTNNASNVLDPTLRKTFFHMNIALKPKFGAYNQFCAGENDGDGQFQGTNMTYGTFSQRIYDLGKYIQAQPTNETINCWFQTEFELEFVTIFCNQMGLQAFQYVIVAEIVSIILTGAGFVIYRYVDKYNHQIDAELRILQAHAEKQHKKHIFYETNTSTETAGLEENSEYYYIQK
ncbi:Conserved_hypothetical protein [Hexamita inflata]|uniref:Transmembrane protein n=1 Tax=Hexamita inflata TaxID=28002 RepID=A0AA86UZH6_9EUKA|nr:Conserved hypothetical protein [Hexamita inflata]